MAPLSDFRAAHKLVNIRYGVMLHCDQNTGPSSALPTDQITGTAGFLHQFGIQLKRPVAGINTKCAIDLLGAVGIDKLKL